MARIKYYYDPEKCKYEKAKVRKTDVLMNILGFLTITLLFAVGLAFLYYKYYDTPVEAQLKKENRELRQHRDVLEEQVEEVDRIVYALKERDNDIYRRIYEAEPIENNLVKTSYISDDKYINIMQGGLYDRKFVQYMHEVIDFISKKAAVNKNNYDEILNGAGLESSGRNIPAIQPVFNPELTKVASGFGTRIHPLHKGRYKHSGIDYAAPRGTPVYATADGVVKLAKKSDLNTGYGNQVEIDHKNGYVTKYAHLSNFKVKKGEDVKRGQVIGFVGNSGGSVAPHLHYEVIQNKVNVNPIYYMMIGLNEDDFDKLLKLSTGENQSFD